MANIKGKRGGVGERTRSRDHVVEEFVPSAAWTEDSDCHFLLLDLPDFKKDEVKLQVDQSGQITVSGERLVNNNNKYIYFEKAFKAPENSDIDKATGKLEGEILYVTVPKKPVQNKEPNNEITNDEDVAKDDKHEKEEIYSDHERPKEEKNDQEHTKNKEEDKKGSSVDGFHKEIIEKWERERSLLERATRMLCKNKEIWLTAAFAFSLGVLVSRKFDI